LVSPIMMILKVKDMGLTYVGYMRRIDKGIVLH
jgi:Tfp pilus assembly protein PilZ